VLERVALRLLAGVVAPREEVVEIGADEPPAGSTFHVWQVAQLHFLVQRASAYGAAAGGLRDGVVLLVVKNSGRQAGRL
jgi:hypothetical protein